MKTSLNRNTNLLALKLPLVIRSIYANNMCLSRLGRIHWQKKVLYLRASPPPLHPSSSPAQQVSRAGTPYSRSHERMSATASMLLITCKLRGISPSTPSLLEKRTCLVLVTLTYFIFIILIDDWILFAYIMCVCVCFFFLISY